MNAREILSHVKDASQHKNPVWQVCDMIYHKLKINTSPIDYYRFQFYKNTLTREQKERFVGKRSSCYYPWQANKVQYSQLFDNKYIFKAMVRGFDLPQPKYITSIGQDYEIKTFERFDDFMFNNTGSIVLKPLDGSGGQGVIVVYFKGQKHFILDEECSAKDIWQKITENKKPYLIEEYVEQIPEMSKLYPWSLNTLRVITIKAKDQKWHLISTVMRTGQGRTQVDNSGAGGIAILVDPAGRSSCAIDWRLHKEIDVHPDTGVKLIGREIPQYKPAVELALRASRKFGFMGTIGWDIGLSTNGPVIIEGNMFYDVSYAQYGAQGPLIPSYLTNRLDRRRWWQRWDKTAMHPRTDRNNIKA